MSTPIEWTDVTWNPVRGCSMAPGSELGGCLNCYAARNQLRRPQQTAANGRPFAIMMDSGPRWTGEVELVESKLTEPLHWKKPRNVFVNSMSDLDHESLPDEAIDRVCAVMALTPHITYQVLTKRAGRLPEYFAREYRRAAIATQASRLHTQVSPFRLPSESIFDGRRVALGLPWEIHAWPLPNVWLGVSVENPPTADARIPKLLQTPAALRFVSYEPALEAVDFTPWLQCQRLGIHSGCSAHLDWIIVGGESGPGARPFNLEWARDTIRQCKAAGVPVFVKQLGSHVIQEGERRVKRDKKGGDMHEWPHDLRVREFPR